MAQRVTSFAKRSAVEQPRADDQAPAPVPTEELEPPDPIPLNLAPLVAPYRKRGRVTVRVERLPHRARLTQGQNNGDRSWSLAQDELEDLAYLPPHGDETTSLSIRIIRVDAGSAQTLAVQEYPLPTAEGQSAVPRTASATGDAKELRQLREEVARTKAALHVRDLELANARRELEAARSEVPREAIEAELTAMRAIWEAEVEERLAMAAKQAAADLQKHRAEWQANADARVAQAEKRAKDRAGDSLTRSRQEIEDAVARAERDWKAAEAARLAAAEAKWQKQSAKALADVTAQFEKSKAKTQADSARTKTDDGELQRLRRELEQANSALAARGEELRSAQAENEKLQREWSQIKDLRQELSKSNGLLAERDRELSRLQTEIGILRVEKAKLGRLGDELAKSKTSLAGREDEFARLRAESDSIRGELERTRSALSASERELAQARLKADQAQAEANNLRGDATELRRIANELSNAKASLAVRDAELGRLRASSDDAKKRWRKDAENALAEAESRWKEAEAERLRESEARWQAQMQKAVDEAVAKIHLAEAQVEEEIERGRSNAIEVGRLAAELTRVKAMLSERENDLVQAKMSHDQARERWKQEADAALARAEASWKAGEAERFAARDSNGQEEARRTLADMTTQVKKLEAALSESRSQIEALRQRGNTDDFRRLRSEFASLQATLANREAELMQLRTDHEIDRERWTQEARMAVQRADQQWHEDDAETAEREQHTQSIRRIVGGGAVAAVLGGLAMFGYFELAPMIADPSTPIGSMVEPILSQTNLAGEPRPSGEAQTTAARVLTLSRSANLRAGPSKSASVIATLARNTQVTFVESAGNWVRVETVSSDNSKQQGWVYKTFLSGPAGESPVSALPSAKP
jgi:chromosome segregation ATPase